MKMKMIEMDLEEFQRKTGIKIDVDDLKRLAADGLSHKVEEMDKMSPEEFNKRSESAIKEFKDIIATRRPKKASYLHEFKIINKWEPKENEECGIRCLGLHHIGMKAWDEMEDQTSQEAIDHVGDVRKRELFLTEGANIEMVRRAAQRADSLVQTDSIPVWKALCCYYALIEALRWKSHKTNERLGVIVGEERDEE